MNTRRRWLLPLVTIGSVLLVAWTGSATDVAEEVTTAASMNDNRVLPPGVLSGTEFRIGHGDVLAPPPGTYYFTLFQLRDDAAIVIRGETRICLAGPGPFEIGGLGVRIRPGASLTILSDSQTKVSVTSRAPFEGTIVEPNAR